MNLKPIKSSYARKLGVTTKPKKNEKKVINIDLIKQDVAKMVFKEVKDYLKSELSDLKFELYTTLRREFKDSFNKIPSPNLIQPEPKETLNDISNELLLKELKAELALLNRKELGEKAPNPLDFNTDFSKSPFGKFMNDSIPDEIEEVKEEDIPVEEPKGDPFDEYIPTKKFNIYGNKVLSFCAEYVYKVEMGKDNLDKKAEKVFEFLKFDAVKNAKISPIDIYSVINFRINKPLRLKLVENNLATEEEILNFNKRFPEVIEEDDEPADK